MTLVFPPPKPPFAVTVTGYQMSKYVERSMPRARDEGFGGWRRKRSYEGG
jgi:hypothetical protein